MVRAAIILLLGLTASAIQAAEIAGRITKASGGGASGAKIVVTCGGYNNSTTVGGDGRYSLNSIPDDAVCSMIISMGDATAAAYKFRANAGKTTIDRKVKPVGNVLLVL